MEIDLQFCIFVGFRAVHNRILNLFKLTAQIERGNGYGRHFRMRFEKRNGRKDHADVVGLRDVINVTFIGDRTDDIDLVSEIEHQSIHDRRRHGMVVRADKNDRNLVLVDRLTFDFAADMHRKKGGFIFVDRDVKTVHQI